MNWLTLAEFRERSEEVAAAAAASSGISAFCSCPLWQLSAHDYLHQTSEEARHLIVESDGAWLILAEQYQPGILFPFESAWMFGCPLLGEPEAVSSLLLEVNRRERAERNVPLAIFFGGLVRGGEMEAAIRSVSKDGEMSRVYPGTDVMMIDLADGVEAWLARRSKKFRRSLRAAEAATTDLTFVDASRDAPELSWERILKIQQGSYKWREGTDIFQTPSYAAFYRSLLFGLHRAGQLRLLFAVQEGRDLAHIFGGVMGATYRGLQMSYIEEAYHLGLGNRLQLESLRRCAAAGITRYDLGMHAPYKERWSDQIVECLGLLWVG